MSDAAQQPQLSPLPCDPRYKYVLSRWVFLRLLGVVYLVAFWSLGVQIVGLVGQEGILPVGRYLAAAKQAQGAAAYWYLPTLCWLSPSDTMLRFLAVGGAALAVMLILDVAPVLVLYLLWGFYLSLSVAGQLFLNFQWDALLLETGLLAAFYAPASIRPRLVSSCEPPVVARWLLWLLTIKLMVLSGVTKLASGDPTWRDLTAMTFHYQTQPLPAWTSWYVHWLPAWFHRGSTVGTYAVEILAPVSAIIPLRSPLWRRVAAVLMVGLQLAIAATGNYGFFNLLSVVLCLTLVDDGVWRRFWPKRFTPGLPAPSERRVWRAMALVAAVLWVPLSALAGFREVAATMRDADVPGLESADRVLSWVAPLRSVNGYVRFSVMTTHRPEIVIEGSMDGRTWKEFPFRYKPGDVNRRPAFIPGHMPRLDWQMWFAALDPRYNEYWLMRLVQRLLRDSRSVKSLLGDSPLEGVAPKYLRLVMYEYRFAPRQPGTSAWWARERRYYLTPPLSLTAAPSPG